MAPSNATITIQVEKDLRDVLQDTLKKQKELSDKIDSLMLMVSLQSVSFCVFLILSIISA